MPQIKKILFPVDFSPSCEGAARYVEAFAGHFEAEIRLVHAVTMGERVLAAELLPIRKAHLDAFLADELKYFTTHRECAIGEPLEIILGSAAQWAPDLVMLPTHGLGYFRRHLIGSVTAKVLHDLTCPVWTSVHAADAPQLEDIHVKRILCAVDLGGRRSRAVLDFGVWLAGEFDARLGIAHASMAVDAAAEAWAVGDEFQRAAIARATAAVAELQEEAGTDAEIFVYPGVPAAVIAGAAREFGADLLVIGRHLDESIAGALFQNAYGILSQSPCPVISI